MLVLTNTRSLRLAVLVWQVVLGLGLAGCSPTGSEGCASRCLGCCSADNQCLDGFSPTACGSAGTVCQACSAGARCSLGACVPDSQTGGGAGGGATGGAGGGATGGGAGGGATGGGAAGGGAADAGTGCPGGCQIFAPAWTFSDASPATNGRTYGRFVNANSVVACLAIFTPNGSFLDRGSRLVVLDRQGQVVRELARLPTDGCWSLEPSPSGQTVAFGSFDVKSRLYPIAGGAPRQFGFFGSHASALTFTKDESALFVGVYRTGGSPAVERVDLASLTNITSALLDRHNNFVDLALSDDELKLSMAMTGFDFDFSNISAVVTVRASDLSVQTTTAGRVVAYQRDPRSDVMGVPVPGTIVDAAPHPTLPKAVTLHQDGMLRLINLTNGRVEAEVRAHVSALSVAFSPDGQWVLSSGDQPQLSAFQLVAGTAPMPSGNRACGNGVVDMGEACDSNSGACTALGFGSGTWTCASDCTINRSACAGLSAGWSCAPQARNDGVCDCGCDAQDPDCGPTPTAASCDTSACQNGTRPLANRPWLCGADTCANVPAAGRCDADVFETCQNGTIVRVDCHLYDRYATNLEPFAAAACRANRGAPRCHVPLGSVCLAQVGSSGQWSTCDEGGACVFDGNVTCKPNLPTCTTGEPTRCLGTDKLQLACVVGQPIMYDCFALGGTCASAQCQGLPQGRSCGSGLTCATGLNCVQGRCG
jgi:WD40 repeat protein